MARHRWATGEHLQGSDRLERVLNLKRAGSQPAGIEAVNGDDDGDLHSVELSDSCPPESDATAARRRPPSGRRWAATRRAALLAAGCALAVGGWQFVSADRTPGEVVPIDPPASSSTAAEPGVPAAEEGTAPAGERADGPSTPHAQGAQTATVVVHVAGAVRTPGVVEIAAGARVFEVLEKAGGAVPEAELAAVNLAAVVQDGQQIMIPRVGEAPPVGALPAPDAETAGGLVNLNTAGATELEELPRVGPVLAERIVEWRAQHGPFARAEDLDAVPGIGPAMLESLLPLVTV
ncbi:helix-hairpin-helix domain-containing protein [Arthrobacter sp. D2-10]